jgi:hypothetical protein
MPADNTLRAAESPAPSHRTLDPSQSLRERPRAQIDKDSIYYSRERYRLIPQRTGSFTIQYLVIDTYENEIVGAHTKMSDAMAQRDALDPVSP